MKQYLRRFALVESSPIIVEGGSIENPLTITLPPDGNVFAIRQAEAPAPHAFIGSINVEGWAEGSIMYVLWEKDSTGRFPIWTVRAHQAAYAFECSNPVPQQFWRTRNGWKHLDVWSMAGPPGRIAARLL